MPTDSYESEIEFATVKVVKTGCGLMCLFIKIVFDCSRCGNKKEDLEQ